MNKRFIALIGLIISSILFTGCTHKETDEAYQAPELLPAAGVASDESIVTLGDHSVLALYDGYVSAYVEEVAFTIDGVISEILVRPGDEVKAGDTLVTLDLENEREQYEKLKTDIERRVQSNEYENRLLEIDISILETEKQALVTNGADKTDIALKDLEIEQARLNLQQQKQLNSADIDMSRRELVRYEEILSNDRIVAPFDGKIARQIEYSPGSYVKAYDGVIYVADHSRLSITTEYITENSANAAYNMYALIGDSRYPLSYVPINREEYLSKLLTDAPIYSTFIITGPDHWMDTVSAGEYAAVIFENNYAEDVLLIPANAVLSDADGKYVYVVGENGERIKRTIRVKISGNSIYAQVLEGLTEGERIYVTDK